MSVSLLEKVYVVRASAQLARQLPLSTLAETKGSSSEDTQSAKYYKQLEYG
jgi:hypothetical protein